MDDGEFWEHVFHTEGIPDRDAEDSEPDDVPDYGRPCEVCGATGECDVDAEGRRMIHVEWES